VSAFIDTGVFYAHHDERHEHHAVATTAFDALLAGHVGELFTSEYVYDEAVTATNEQQSLESARRLSRRIRGDGSFPAAIQLQEVTSRLFEDAVRLFERPADPHLTFTDATTVVLVEEHGIDSVVSFDPVFDGLVHRIDPEEFVERDELLE
jgi:predicted nucleic acid-binding protein